MSGSHKEFPKKAVGIQLGLAALVGIGFLVSDKPAAHASAEKEAKPIVVAAAKVLAPIGKVEIKADTGGAAARSGEEVYKSTCGTCHDNGIAGAPKLDDKASWETRLAGGYSALVTSAIKGKGGMPARGGNPDITDPEMELVVSHMIKKAGIDLVPRSAGGSAPAPAAAVTTEEKTIVEKTVEEAKDTVVETAEVVADKAVEAKEAVVETVTETIEDAKEVVSETVETVADKVDEAKEVVAETVETVVDKVDEVKTDAVAAVTTTATAAKAAVDHSAGEAIYKSSCFACHDSGVAGSPKLGDKEAWVPRIATGNDQLYASSINGKGAMPAKGGNTSISDDDIKAAVDYMVSKAK